MIGLKSVWPRSVAFYAFIVFLHVLGCGTFVYYVARYPSLVGLGLAAYLFGLRHAFDADHIAAIDDTVRFLVQKGQKPLGCGFFFSLGHSTVVLLLSVALSFAAMWVKHHLPGLQQMGGLIGTVVSGAFLWLIGLLNLMVFLDLVRVWTLARSHRHEHPGLTDILAQRGFLNRFVGGRLQNLISHSWQLYPVGLLFGVGFDTASEVALLAMTAGAAAGNLPILAVLCLPILFAAGMCLMDTTDGMLMCHAYQWALLNPLRKLFYNLTTTGISVALALGIGTIELVQVAIRIEDSHGPVLDWISDIDLGSLGFWIVGLFLAAWGLSVAVWKRRDLSASHAMALGTSDGRDS
jgi:high-affinity nickel-transport protein